MVIHYSMFVNDECVCVFVYLFVYNFFIIISVPLILYKSVMVSFTKEMCPVCMCVCAFCLLYSYHVQHKHGILISTDAWLNSLSLIVNVILISGAHTHTLTRHKHRRHLIEFHFSSEILHVRYRFRLHRKLKSI